MCGYCEWGKDLITLYSMIEHEGETLKQKWSVNIGNDEYNEISLILNHSGSTEDEVPVFAHRINFCPICGRKLKRESEEK